MPHTVKVALTVEIDGTKRDDLSFTRRVTVDELSGFAYEKAHDGAGTFSALPTNELAELQFLLVRTDQQVTVRFDGQTDAGVVVNAGGFLLLCDVDIDAAAATNATVSNVSGATATLRGVAGGT